MDRLILRRWQQQVCYPLLAARVATPSRAASSPSSSSTLFPRGEGDDVQKRQVLANSGTAGSVRQLVRDAVLGPHAGASPHAPTASAAPHGGLSADSDDSGVYAVQVFDRNGMPADMDPSAPKSFDDLLNMTPDPLRRQLQELIDKKHWLSLTSVQKHVIPFTLEYRDVLCVAPTATGKTFAYVFPTMLRLLLDDQQAQRGRTRTRADGEEDHLLQRHDVEQLLQERINKGEVCRYCELDVRVTRLCPMTGSLHAPPPETDGGDEVFMGRARRAERLRELTSTASPRALVLVPTSQLAFQVHGVFQSLHSDFVIRYMVRASSADEQQKHLRALQDGVDVLITTPETILPALFKRKLSLQQVRTIVLDEVDDLVSVNHYEKLKIILGALPRHGAERPQRLLFAASLPTVAYNMLKERTLQPSHRFILADTRRDALGRAVTASRTIAGPAAVPSLEASTHTVIAGQQALLTVNASIQHFVLMLGRVEKLHKLAWLYQTGKLTLDQRVLIFCNSRHNVAYVAEHLPGLVPGLNHITTITSHASATARAGVMKQFSGGLSTCLVATDIVSRGIDFHDVVYVVNYDMPLDMDTFVHRSGRCGRRQPSQWMAHAQPTPRRLDEPDGGTTSAPEERRAASSSSASSAATSGGRGRDDGESHAAGRATFPVVPPQATTGYVYTFFQPENVKLAKPLVAYLRQNGQLVPPTLAEYARKSFVDVFRNSLFHHPTRPYRKSDPQNSTPVNGRGTPRYPDYKQERINRHFRPL